MTALATSGRPSAHLRAQPAEDKLFLLCTHTQMLQQQAPFS